MASDTVPVSQKAHEQCLLSAIKNDDHIDVEASGGKDVTMKEFKSGEHDGKGLEDLSSEGRILSKEAGDNTIEFRNLCKEPSLKACKAVDALTFGDPYNKTSNDMVTEELDKKSHLAFESEEFAVEREVVDYKEQSGNSSPEVISRDIFSSQSPDIVEKNKQDHHMIEEPNVVGSVTGKDVSDTDPGLELLKPAAILESCGKTENGKYDLDLNKDVSSEDLDCELSLFPFNPINPSAPVVVSVSKGAPELPIIPLHIECELDMRSSAATSAFHPASPTNALNVEDMMSDSKQKGNFAEIDLKMAMDPILVKELHAPYGISSRDSSVEFSLERAETIQLGLSCVEEEEEAPTILQLSSSTQPTMRNFDLNDDPFVRGSDPVFTILDPRMFVERRDELSTQAFIMGIENTPSSSNCLDMTYGMMEIENGSSEEGSLHLFMPETRNFLGEQMNTDLRLSTSMNPLKRKEPDSGWESYGFDYKQLTLTL